MSRVLYLFQENIPCLQETFTEIYVPQRHDRCNPLDGSKTASVVQLVLQSCTLRATVTFAKSTSSWPVFPRHGVNKQSKLKGNWKDKTKFIKTEKTKKFLAKFERENNAVVCKAAANNKQERHFLTKASSVDPKNKNYVKTHTNAMNVN